MGRSGTFFHLEKRFLLVDSTASGNRSGQSMESTIGIQALSLALSAEEPESGSQAAPYPERESLVSGEDRALIVALRSGKRGAAEALYRKLVPAVRRALWRVLGNSSADCDDLIQITFERVVSTIINGTYREACSLRSWATSLATYAAVDHLRALCREKQFIDASKELALESEKATAADAEQSIVARSELERLRSSLSRMRPLDAQALLLRYGAGYSIAEVAAALGATEYSLSSRLARARRELLRRAGHLRDDM
jgi:RNA polymerase sigma-70 factor (ECF subfamily)